MKISETNLKKPEEEEPQEELLPGESPPPEVSPGVTSPPYMDYAIRKTIAEAQGGVVAEEEYTPVDVAVHPGVAYGVGQSVALGQALQPSGAKPVTTTPLDVDDLVADWETSSGYKENLEKIEADWTKFQADWKARWGGRVLVSDLQAQEWESAKTIYEENKTNLAAAREEAIKSITEQVKIQREAAALGAEFDAMFDWQTIEGNQYAYAKDIDTVMAKIPAYRDALNRWYELLMSYSPQNEEEKANLEEVKEGVLGRLEWLYYIEENPEIVMRPEQVFNRMNWWQRAWGTLSATPKWQLAIPGWNIIRGVIAPAMAALPEPVRHGFEAFDEIWGAFGWQMLKAIPEFFTASSPQEALKAFPPYAGIKSAMDQRFWEPEAREAYKEEVPGWGQLMISLANPVYWIALPVGGKAIQFGLRAARIAPSAIRGLPMALRGGAARGAWEAEQVAAYQRVAGAWWVPEHIPQLQRLPTLSFYGRMTTKYPAIAAKLPRIASLMEPVSPVMATALEPVSIAARGALWGLGLAGKGAKVAGKAYFGLYGMPFKAIGVAGKPLAEQISARVPTLQLVALRRVAAKEGIKIKYLGKALEENPYAQYVIEGPAGRVFARDIAEVQAYVFGKSLIPKDPVGLLERIYVGELDEVISKAEFLHPEVLGGAIRETAAGTVYSLPGRAGAEISPLTVITETQLLQAFKPKGVPQALWDKAKVAYNKYIEEASRMVSEMAKMDIPWNDVLKRQIFIGDRAQRLAIKVASIPGASSVVRTINASALAESIAEQSSIMWASILWRGQAYKGFLQSRLMQFGHSSSVLGIKMRSATLSTGEKVKVPIVTKVKTKPGTKPSMALGDVIEGAFAPDSPYIFNQNQINYIKAVHNTIDDIANFIEREQAKMAEHGWIEKPWFHRREMAEGWHYVTRVRRERLNAPKAEVINTQGARIGALPGPFRERVYETMMEGALRGNVYGRTVEEYVATYADAAIRLVGDKRLAYEIEPLGKTVTEMAEAIRPGLHEQLLAYRNRLRFLGGGQVEYTQEGLKIVKQVPGLKAEVMNIIRGKVPVEQTVQAVEHRFPEIGDRLRKALNITPPTFREAIKNITDEMWRVTGITRERFAEAVEQVRFEMRAGRPMPTVMRGAPRGAARVEGEMITQGELTAALHRLNVETHESGKLLTKIYEEAYRYAKAERSDALKSLFKDIDVEISATRAALKALQGQWDELTAMIKHSPKYTAIHEHPALQGKLFDVEVANSLRSVFNEQAQNWLKITSRISGILRTAIAALDFSAPFIQGLPVLGIDFSNALAGRPTFAWARATLRHYSSFFFERVHGRYMAQNEKAIAEFTQKYGGYVGGSEWYEAMGEIQSLVRGVAGIFGKEGDIPVWLLQQTYGRAERAFGAFGDVARIELWKAFRHSTKQEELYTLAQTINKMTGVIDSRGLGIGVNQRMIESAFVFFAPRYTRAGIALMGDIFRGGLRGDMARKAFSGYLAGGTAYYIGTCYALGQTPNLDPRSASVFTITVGNQRVGLGGFYTWALRFMANVAYAAYNDPKALIVLSRKDSPFMKAGYAKSSALMNFAVGLITKRTFLGDPIETGADYARYLASQITPIALQSAFLEGEKANLPGYIAELLGLRSFPKSVWDHLREKRDYLAPFAPDLTAEQKEVMKERPLLWSDLNEYQRAQLVKENPDLQELMDEVTALKVRRGDEFSGLMQTWRKTYDDMVQWGKDQRQMAMDEYYKNMDLKKRWREGDPTLTVEQISAAKTAGKTLRDKLKNINEQLAARRMQIELDYVEVYDAFKQWAEEEKPEMYYGDVAYREYLDLLYEQEGLYDEYGNYQFDEAANRKNAFLDDWGWDVWMYVQKRLEQSREEPPLLQELRTARQMLRPYWEIRDRLEAEGTYPIDSETQEQWIRERLQGENPQAYHTYEVIERMRMTNPPLYDRYRRMMYIQAIYRYVESIRVPTLDSAIGTERERWRMEHPEAEPYLWAFYDIIPLAEHKV